VINNRAGFMSKFQRLNVIASRARYELYILGTKKHIDNCKSRMLVNFQSEYLVHRVKIDKPKADIISKYYQNGLIEWGDKFVQQDGAGNQDNQDGWDQRTQGGIEGFESVANELAVDQAADTSAKKQQGSVPAAGW
jgi:hypothetical protein